MWVLCRFIKYYTTIYVIERSYVSAGAICLYLFIANVVTLGQLYILVFE